MAAAGADRVAFVATADRERLPDLLTAGPASPAFAPISLGALVERHLAPRCALIGYWDDRGDPFPDFIIVNDQDLGDTHAWLSAYAAGLAPITQWCRLWTRAQLRELLTLPSRTQPTPRIGPWVGAIVAECAVQARMQINLKALSGTSALSSASFAAARAAAVWGEFPHFVELAQRHDALSERLRDRSRPVAATQMTALWYALAGERWASRPPAENRILAPFRDVFSLSMRDGWPAIERAAEVAQRVTDEFDLPDLAACGRGPQAERVDALDRLAARLGAGPQSAAIDALLGFAASLIEPGAAVMPDLLRRFDRSMPTAPIWAGAFAGLWAPVRVLADHQGLGRLIAKALVRDSDLFAKPEADIGFDELIRWLPSGQSGRAPVVRGMAVRTLEVELLPGVTAPFVGRGEPGNPVPAAGASATPRQRPLDLGSPDPARTSATPTLADVTSLVNGLAARVAALEAEKTVNARNSGRSTAARKRKTEERTD